MYWRDGWFVLVVTWITDKLKCVILNLKLVKGMKVEVFGSFEFSLYTKLIQRVAPIIPLYDQYG